MGKSLLVALALAAFGGDGAPDGRLVLGVHGHGEFAAVADPSTGAIAKRRLPGGALCHGPVLAIADRVVYSGYGGRRAVARTLPLSLRGPARSLGAADTFTPTHSQDSVWLSRGHARGGRSWLALHQVDPAGRVLVAAPMRGSRWGLLHAAIRRGFAVTVRDSLVVWDHALDRPELTARGGRFLAASDTRVAWCQGSCPRMRVWSRGGGQTLTPPAGMRLLGAEGSFSPDGRLLAVGVTTSDRTRVAVVGLRSGAWTLVPGGKLGGYDAVAWSPSGRWLYFTESNRRLRGWQHGAPVAMPLPVQPDGTVMSIDVTR